MGQQTNYSIPAGSFSQQGTVGPGYTGAGYFRLCGYLLYQGTSQNEATAETAPQVGDPCPDRSSTVVSVAIGTAHHGGYIGTAKLTVHTAYSPDNVFIGSNTGSSYICADGAAESGNPIGYMPPNSDYVFGTERVPVATKPGPVSFQLQTNPVGDPNHVQQCGGPDGTVYNDSGQAASGLPPLWGFTHNVVIDYGPAGQGGTATDNGVALPVTNASSSSSGGGTPTPGQVASALSQSLTVSGPASTIPAVLAAGGFTAGVIAPGAGTEQISWYYLPAGAQLASVAKHAKPVLVASGSKTFSGKGRARIKLKLSGAGRTLLRSRRKHSLGLTAKGSFTPRGGAKVSKRRKISLKG